jgi:hypothetical protein
MFILGLFVGSAIGFFTAALLAATRDYPPQDNPNE